VVDVPRRRRIFVDARSLAVYGFALLLLLASLKLLPSTINLDLWLAVGIAVSLYLWLQLRRDVKRLSRLMGRVDGRVAKLERRIKSARTELEESLKLRERVERLEDELRRLRGAT